MSMPEKRARNTDKKDGENHQDGTIRRDILALN